MKPLTLKEKAAAFDHLFKIFDGKAKVVHSYARVTRTQFPAPGAPVEPTVATERVTVYEWILRAEGTPDFAEAMAKTVRALKLKGTK